MTSVTYFLASGLPCDTASGVSGVTLTEALNAFAAYRDDCERFGNHWRDASLEVVFDIPSSEASRLYAFGPRGGIVRVEE